MQAAIDETERRRARQSAYNQEHGITARTIQKAIRRGIEQELQARKIAREAVGTTGSDQEHDRDELIRMLTDEMMQAAKGLEFERAAELRDQIASLKAMPDFGKVKIPQGPQPGEAGSKAGITGRKKRRAAF